MAMSSQSREKLIDGLCDEFEKKWQSDSPVSLEAVVLTVEEEYRPELFRELLAIESEYRFKRGRPISIAEARGRFANLGPWTASIILEILATTQSWSKVVDAGAAKPVPVNPVRQVIGNYELQSKLGQGSFGAVYKSLHINLKRYVALKILFPQRVDTPQGVARFRREMEAIGTLNHPNVIRPTDAGEVDGYYYLAMEYIDGADLGRILRSTNRLTIGEACEIIRQVAEGLEYISNSQLVVVHRDIKPSNIFLGADGIVRILDLGLARLSDSEGGDRFTHTGVVMGTADYISPEQARESRDVDIRSDIYSLGCTFYALLAGSPPFADLAFGSAYEKFKAHMEVPPTPIETLCPELPPELCQLIRRMLEKAPSARPQKPQEIARQVEPFCAGANLAQILKSVKPVAGGAIGAVKPKVNGDDDKANKDEAGEWRHEIEPDFIVPSNQETSLPALTDPTTVTHQEEGLPSSRFQVTKAHVALVTLVVVGIGILAIWLAPKPLSMSRDGIGSGETLDGNENRLPYRTYRPGEWEDVLDRAPRTLHWPKAAVNSPVQFHPQEKDLSVVCQEWGILELAEIDRPDFDVEAHFLQAPWVGGIGVYICPGEIIPTHPVTKIANAVIMDTVNPQSIQDPGRIILSNISQPPGETIYRSFFLSPSGLTRRPISQSYKLTLRVEAYKIVHVTWDGQNVSDLPLAGFRTGTNTPNRATIGLFAENSSTTVKSVKVRIPK